MLSIPTAILRIMMSVMQMLFLPHANVRARTPMLMIVTMMTAAIVTMVMMMMRVMMMR